MSNQLTVAEQRKSFLQVIQGDSFKKQIALALPKHLTPDRMLRVALTAMNKTPGLYECDPNTVMACLMDCSALGLEPDNRNAYLIPFNDKRKGKICQLIVGYQGLIELGYRHPSVTGIRAKAVYEKDDFTYDEGLHPRLEHRPYDGDGEPGALKYAYAICNIGDRGSTFVVLNRRQVMKAKNFSRGSDGEYSPWRTSEEAMWVKTAVRALAKFMPRSTELSHAIQVDDDQTGSIDIGSTVIPTGNVGSSLPTPPIEKTITERAQEEAAAAPVEHTEAAKSQQATVSAPEAAATPTAPAPEKKPAGPSAESLRKQILAKGTELNAGKVKIQNTLRMMGWIKPEDTLDSLDADTLANVLAGWDQVSEAIKNPPETK
jgi:recombination protein RecT